jgi:RNA polymerase sigma factor (sigma-70 family)
MRTASTRPVSDRNADPERAYFDDLASIPRFDAARETELAQSVVTTRAAYWRALVDRAHLGDVLGTIASRARDASVTAAAIELRDAAEIEAEALADLVSMLTRIGDEHALSDALVELASKRDARWHREVVRARSVFLAARNRFVGANLRLVIGFAQRYGRNCGALADRIQEGNLGLMKAVDRFDPSRGVRFSTYAAWWIRHAIARGVAEGVRMVRVPPQLQRIFFKAERARLRLRTELGREPELRELAIAVDCDPKRLTLAIDLMELRSVSIDVGPGDGMPAVPASAMSDQGSLDDLESVIEARDRARAVAALAELPAREQDIVHERYAFPGATAETLEEIGRRHGISRERTRQLQRVALDHLRRKLEPRVAVVPYGP